MKRWKIFSAALVCTLFAGCAAEKGLNVKEGELVHGFKLVKKQFVKEVDADCFLFEHERSGARLLKVAAKDDNKTFSIAFKTPPPNDTGLPHIMEHSVLNGSEHFPVKSPFDILAQGSLNTFLNAMTSSDFTIYPVASRNMKDYFNLMHVYLDAVFLPLLHEDDRILKQEGWHYELESPDSPLVYKGVVYNEMKGAFSSPQQQLAFLMNKKLFPDNPYSNSSGGWPEAIPELTQEQFRDFHNRYYHPSNSYIFVYGDADLNEELEFIDREYLSGYDRIDVATDIPLQASPDKAEIVKSAYGLPAGAETQNQTFIAWGAVVGRNIDRELAISLDILSDALVNNESAPLRRAFLEAGLGKDVSAYVDTTQQNVFQISVQNADPGDLDRFQEILVKTLTETAEAGLDHKVLEGLINRMEFRLREGRGGAMTGVVAAMTAMTGWLFAEDPFLSLSYEKPLAAIKANLEEGYFEGLIKDELLNNTHAVTVVMEPKPGLEKEKALEVQEKLAAVKAGLSKEEIEKLVEETQELIAYQKREDTPEALKSIPLLEIADIDKKEADYSLEKRKVGETDLLYHEDFTKGIVYLDFYFKASGISQDMIPFLQLYNQLIGLIDTEEYSYQELENEINAATGGISTRINAFLMDLDDEKLQPYFTISGKAMPDKLGKMLELTDQQLNHTLWEKDPARLLSLITRMKAQMEQMLVYNGIGIAQTRLASYFSNLGAYNDRIQGVDYYRFLCDLTKNLKNDPGQVIKKFRQIEESVLNRRAMFAALTCQQDTLAAVETELSGFMDGFPDAEFVPADYRFEKIARNEGFMDASKVQYVLKGYDYKKLGVEYNGKMAVLRHVLEGVYLQKQIRVIGGAYGGIARIDRNGMFAFASYRDPNLRETVDNYLGAADFLRNFKPAEPEMRRLIIGTISGRDRPLTPNSKGRTAVQRYLSGITIDRLQQERMDILNTTPEDIQGFADLVNRIMSTEYLCVVGNEKKIEEQKDLFKTVEKLRE